MSKPFENLIGQENVKKKLNFYLKAYEATSVCPFLNLVGAKGLGKTPLEYRHSVREWFLLYEKHGNEAVIFLSIDHPLRAQGDIVEQLESRNYLREYNVIFETVKDIFWNNSTFEKPNGDKATEKDKDKPGYMGGLRRYVVVIEMLLTIYDLSVIKKSRLRKELGVEFK